MHTISHVGRAATAAILVAVALAAGACRNNTEVTPTDANVDRQVVPSDVQGDDVQADAAPDVAPDAVADAAADAGADAGSDAADDAPVDAAACRGDGGCFACAPRANPDFFNHCTTAACAPFNNATRLPLWDGGALPPLP